MFKRVFPPALLFVHALTFVRSTSAQTMFSTRFGAANTNVAIGVVNGRVSIVEQRTSDGACETQQISTGNKLTNFVRFFAGNGKNRVRAASPSWPASLCGQSITAPVPGFNVFVDAGAGDDIVVATPLITADGGDNNDTLVGDGMWFKLNGGSGNDWVIQTSDVGAVGELDGNGGSDHLCDLGDGSNMFGGSGTDYTWNAIIKNSVENNMPSGDDCSSVALAVVLTQPF